MGEWVGPEGRTDGARQSQSGERKNKGGRGGKEGRQEGRQEGRKEGQNKNEHDNVQLFSIFF